MRFRASRKWPSTLSHFCDKELGLHARSAGLRILTNSRLTPFRCCRKPPHVTQFPVGPSSYGWKSDFLWSERGKHLSSAPEEQICRHLKGLPTSRIVTLPLLAMCTFVALTKIVLYWVEPSWACKANDSLSCKPHGTIRVQDEQKGLGVFPRVS